MLECIFLEPSEIDRKGAEKDMAGPAPQGIEIVLSPFFFGLRVEDSLTAIALAIVVLAAFFFLLCCCLGVWGRYCNVVENHHRLVFMNQGNQGR